MSASDIFPVHVEGFYGSHLLTVARLAHGGGGGDCGSGGGDCGGVLVVLLVTVLVILRL